MSGDVMVNGHLLQPGRSVSTKHVRSDVLLKTANKNCVASPGRKSASICVLRLQAARKTGRSLQGLEYNFFFFQGCLCKERVVITKNYESNINPVSKKKIILPLSQKECNYGLRAS